MYIRNIIDLVEDLKNNEKLVLYLKSGNTATILKDDVVNIISADLKVTRALYNNGRNVMIIDPNEVEKCLICNEEFL